MHKKAMVSGWFDHVLIVGNNRPFVVVLLMLDETAANEFVESHNLEDKEEVVQSWRFQKIINELISKIDKKN